MCDYIATRRTRRRRGAPTGSKKRSGAFKESCLAAAERTARLGPGVHGLRRLDLSVMFKRAARPPDDGGAEAFHCPEWYVGICVCVRRACVTTRARARAHTHTHSRARAAFGSSHPRHICVSTPRHICAIGASRRRRKIQVSRRTRRIISWTRRAFVDRHPGRGSQPRARGRRD